MSTSFVLVYERYVVMVGGGVRGCSEMMYSPTVLSKHLGTSKCLLNLRQMLT